MSAFNFNSFLPGIFSEALYGSKVPQGHPGAIMEGHSYLREDTREKAGLTLSPIAPAEASLSCLPLCLSRQI